MTVTDEALVLDGNAVAGLLAEVFGGAEVTGAVRGCGSCGQRHAVGKHRLYRGAGLVLRCPGCGDVALVVVERGAQRDVRMRGSWALSVPVASA
ncbi:DUF6510 family protein [Baekduia sp.]|jgi:hypothetical protein|uniref:DUF6510 family protein n=1 Tax=Baekduia sp. TaxID=2600305 RepID=UPI0039C86C64